MCKLMWLCVVNTTSGGILTDGRKEGAAACKASLGRALCTSARRVLTDEVVKRTLHAVDSARMWQIFMREHMAHVKTDSDCVRYDQFHKLKWQPSVFTWPEGGAGFLKHVANDVLRDAQVSPALDFKPTLSDLTYGPIDVRVEHVAKPAGGVMTRMARVQPAGHLWTLRHATGLVPANFSTVLEFGGGTGDLASVLRGTGFGGLHLIYDFPAMLLHLRYWHRLAGIPSYLLGSEIPLATAKAHTKALNGKVVLTDGLTSSPPLLHDLLPALRLDAPTGHNLVIGTWSFSEAGSGTREKFRPVLRRFSHILMTYSEEQEGDYAKTADFRRYLAEDLHPTYSVCAWQMRWYSN